MKKNPTIFFYVNFQNHFKCRKSISSTAEIAENTEIAEIAKNAEITNSLTGKKNEKDHFRIRKSSTKFHIKIRKTHFKIRKWNFKKVLFKNDKSKKVLEIDVEKDGGIFFSIKIFWVNMDSPVKYIFSLKSECHF